MKHLFIAAMLLVCSSAFADHFDKHDGKLRKVREESVHYTLFHIETQIRIIENGIVLATRELNEYKAMRDEAIRLGITE